MNRFGAFLVHLGISLLIFAVLAYLVVYVWYPDFFFASDGGWQGIRIIALVDLVLGPLLTFVVFNHQKPRRELQRDLSVIGTIQAACLVAGVWVVYSERPLALVYVDGMFFSITADDFAEAGVEIPDLSDFPGTPPKRLVVDMPLDPLESALIRRKAWQERRPLRTLADRYSPYSYERLNAQKEALTSDWLDQREAETGDISDWLAERGGQVSRFDFFPFGARYGLLVLGVSRETGQIEGLLRTPLKLISESSAGSREG